MADHVVLSINGLIVYDSATDTTQPPEGGGGGEEGGGGGGDTPPTFPPSFTFTWQKSGEVLINDLVSTITYSYQQPVPAGYSGPLYHDLVPQTGGTTPDYLSHIEAWESWEPGGDPITPAAFYEGPAGMGMSFAIPGWTVAAAPTDRVSYFNLIIYGQNARLGVQQKHA